MAFYYVQSLSRPADGTQLAVSTTYTITFNVPYTMYVSSWNAAEDNIIKLYWRDASGAWAGDLKTQTVVKGNNTFSFRLSDYGLNSNNVSEIGIQLNAYIAYPSDSLNSLYFEDKGDYGETSYEYGVVFHTACSAPSSFSCSPTLTDSTTTLSWSGAKAGTSNTIASYEIQYCESSDGKTWGSWQALISVTSTATSGTKGVSASATYGNYRKFRIRTRGSAGSSYYSGWKESTNTVRRNHAPFSAWTDTTLTAGTTPVKAVHMKEMQDRINTLLTFYHLSTATFTTITAGATLLKGWTSHITELRNAIDRITTSHDAWITISVNQPRVDVVNQIRNIIDGL